MKTPRITRLFTIDMLEFIAMLDEYLDKRNQLTHDSFSTNFWIKIKDSRDSKSFIEGVEDTVWQGEQIRKNISVLSNLMV